MDTTSGRVEGRTRRQVVCGPSICVGHVQLALGKFGEVEIELGMVCCRVRDQGEVLIVEVVCDRSSTMADDESSSLDVRVFMTEKEALWYEFEHGFS